MDQVNEVLPCSITQIVLDSYTKKAILQPTTNKGSTARRKVIYLKVDRNGQPFLMDSHKNNLATTLTTQNKHQTL